MNGPYDWVPPNYWYDRQPYADRYGSTFGFGSELGPGVGTPELGSLKKFLTEADMKDLWTKPNKGLYHMSTNVSQFYDRSIYNEALYARYGEPTSLDDYLLKTQIMDYEAIRAEHEGFAMKWSEDRPATGMVYWMMNNAWPSLHWNQFDYYLHPAGSFFGSKVGARVEHVAYDYVDGSVWIINRSLDRSGPRKIEVEVIGLNGKVLSSAQINTTTTANTAAKVAPVNIAADDVTFLRLILSDNEGRLSRNVYWVAPTLDKLAWGDSTWYHTPVTAFADYKSLATLAPARLIISQVGKTEMEKPNEMLGLARTLTLENDSEVPAFFVRLNIVDETGNDVVPILWSDNYFTLWPGESIQVQVLTRTGEQGTIEISGGNVDSNALRMD